MRTVAIINQKGGCGKTTTSINLAACLARLGQKTLLVDMDPQGHCGIGLAVPEDQIERTIFDAMIEEQDGKVARVSEIVWQIASEFDLAPSNIKLAAFEQLFAGRIGRDDRLTRALSSVADTYQWCIIDCPPSVGLLTFNALRACDEVIVPVETGFFSLHGLAKMMETLEIMKDKCSKAIQVRVLPTLYDTRTKLAREVLSELRAKFRDYLMESTVNFNTKLKEAASFGQPITEYDPGSRGYKDFVNLARELMGHRPVDLEPTPRDRLSRPAELVQRAKQLSQLTNFQFGRHSVPQPAAAAPAPAPVTTASVATLERTTTTTTVADPFEPVEAIERRAVVEESPILMKSALELLDPIEVRELTSNKPAPKTTEQKLEEIYGVRKVGGEVVFTARFEDARKVLIAGDFNNWSAMSTPMQTNGKPGVWQMRLPLAHGRYRYRFIVDGQWVTDPHNTYVEANQFGELNNVIEVD